MAGLLDFLQSASNTAASNVSAPVDGLAWLLRKAGLNIGEPVGGSDWMQRQGLTRPVEQSGASLAGEAMGLLSPIGVAAKAPQIARGLLRGSENLAAPRVMNPQTGAVVWHGSPHKFDKFDSSKIGTGEGVQAYGHGLYLAESPDVAKSYLATGQAVKAADRPTEMVARAIDASGGDEVAARVWLQNRLSTSIPEYKELYSSALKGFDSLKPQGSSIYKVDLPDEHIAKMLDWDKPLSQQHPDVQAAMRDLNGKDALGRPLERASPLSQDSNGQWAYMNIQEGRNQRLASEALAKKGIPGIRYLDGGSRTGGTGTSNFVVFPGNEGLLSILERNGAPIK